MIPLARILDDIRTKHHARSVDLPKDINVFCMGPLQKTSISENEPAVENKESDDKGLSEKVSEYLKFNVRG